VNGYEKVHKTQKGKMKWQQGKYHATEIANNSRTL
jgi:hypothetical protein